MYVGCAAGTPPPAFHTALPHKSNGSPAFAVGGSGTGLGYPTLKPPAEWSVREPLGGGGGKTAQDRAVHRTPLSLVQATVNDQKWTEPTFGVAWTKGGGGAGAGAEGDRRSLTPFVEPPSART